MKLKKVLCLLALLIATRFYSRSLFFLLNTCRFRIFVYLCSDKLLE